MLTWTLWRALQRPPVSHPLYRRTLSQRPREGLRLDEGVTLRLLWRLALPLVFISIFALTPVIFPLVLVTPVLLPIIVNWFSVQWAIKTGSAIAREHEQGTYPLIALIPFGAFGASWTICSACMNRDSSFADLHAFVRILARFLLFVLAVALVIAVVIAANRGHQTSGNMFVTLISMAALAAAFYIDYVQSSVVGALVGMLAPTYTRYYLDSRAWGFFSYLLLQVSVYLTAWLLGFIVVPAVFQSLHFTGVYTGLCLPVLRVAVLYFVREGTITILWRILTQRLNAAPSDLNVISP